MPQQFKPGDQVQLKSGGPIMTVVKYDDYSHLENEVDMKYLCRFFDSKHELKEHTFTEAESLLVS